ncbi:nuclear transport factor 2 family protein [Massilia sp. BHUDP2]|uniref:nuclear transport factor 2 family protein n=1 Tax=Massilia sp. BHUDP2 TaxID=3034505 RepID=UPI00390629AE
MRPLPAVLLCLASLLLPFHAVASDAAARDARLGVREAERQRALALNERDIELLRRLMGGNYRHVETNGRLRSKTEFLQALARDEYRIRNYGLEDMEVEVVNEDVAIVTGTWRAARLDLGTAQPLRGRYVRVWTRQPEGWRISLHQGTEIKTAAAQPAKSDTRGPH